MPSVSPRWFEPWCRNGGSILGFWQGCGVPLKVREHRDLLTSSILPTPKDSQKCNFEVCLCRGHPQHQMSINPAAAVRQPQQLPCPFSHPRTPGAAPPCPGQGQQLGHPLARGSVGWPGLSQPSQKWMSRCPFWPSGLLCLLQKGITKTSDSTFPSASFRCFLAPCETTVSRGRDFRGL